MTLICGKTLIMSTGDSRGSFGWPGPRMNHAGDSFLAQSVGELWPKLPRADLMALAVLKHWTRFNKSWACNKFTVIFCFHEPCDKNSTLINMLHSAKKLQMDMRSNWITETLRTPWIVVFVTFRMEVGIM